MPNTDQWIEITNFSTGIMSDFDRSQHVAPVNGAATVENTYRCYATPYGALSPLPARTPGPTRALPAGTDAAQYPHGVAVAYLSDAVVQSNVRPSVLSPLDDTSDAVVTAYVWGYDTDGIDAFYGYGLVTIHQPWTDITPFIDAFFHRSAGAASSLFIEPAIDLERVAMADASVDPVDLTPGDPTPRLAILFSVGTVTTNNLNPLGVDELTWTQYPSDIGTDFPARRVATYTWDGATPELDDQGWNVGSFATYLFQHQNRLAVSGDGPARFADGSMITDIIDYTLAAIYNSDTELLVTAENPSGYGAIQTLNASELLAIKNYGGAVLIRGDLNNPNILRLPYVESTYGAVYKGVNCPLGFVYATPNGIFAWAGNPTADRVSQQLEGRFFEHRTDLATERFSGSLGRLGWYHPFLCVPNNYLYDTRTKAWWRLEQPDTDTQPAYSAYDTSGSDGTLYAFPHKITPDFGTQWDTYDWSSLASTYSWQSQPLIESRDKVINFKMMELVAERHPDATGLCYVYVTLHGVDQRGNTIDPPLTTTQFLLDESSAGRIYINRQNLKPPFSARYIHVRIQAESEGGPAPKVLGLRLATADGPHINAELTEIP